MSTSTGGDALQYLMALYYNEDYFIEYGGIWETLDAFLAHDPHLAPSLPHLISNTLTRFQRTEDLEQYLEEAGCAYNTSLYPGGVRAWLTEISRRVEQWLTTNAPS